MNDRARPDDLAAEPSNALAPAFAASNALAAAFATYQASGARDASSVLDAFYRDSRVRRIIDSNVRYSRLFDHQHKEELKQRLAELFWQKLIPLLLETPDNSAAVYVMVNAGAKWVSKSIGKERSRDEARNVSLDEPDDDMMSPLDYQVQSEDFTTVVNAQIDQELAGRELQRRLAMNPLSHHPLVEFVDPKAAATRPSATSFSPTPSAPKSNKRAVTAPTGKASKTPSKTGAKKTDLPAGDVGSAELLTKIREKLQLKNADFAQRLGIGLPTLSSYLYGRVQKVPDKVMNAAKALLGNGPSETDRAVAIFVGMTMPEVVARWERKLKLVGNADADKLIAFVLDVNPTTVYRWRDGQSELSVPEIAKHDNTVSREAKARAANRAAG